MSRSVLEKFVEKILRKVYKDRRISLKKVGKRWCIITHDVLSKLEYSLVEKYDYNDVIKLNEMTGYTARFGYNPIIGPVAFIGIPNPNFDFSFFKEVWCYGESFPEEELEFRKYERESAKYVSDYKVYGLRGLSSIKDFVKFDKIAYVCDTRENIKHAKEKRIFNMDFMLDGKYSLREAKKMVEHNDFRLMGNTITFAMVGENLNVGIIGMFPSQVEECAGFKDVWEYGKLEPKTQSITFLSDEEANEIDEFVLYGYEYFFPENLKYDYPIIKLDRTFDKKFDFYDTKDGKDLRLIKSELIV